MITFIYSRDRCVKLPQLLCGDFDSITSEALHFFKENGVIVKETPDQDYPDIWKALKLMANTINQKNLKVAVFCSSNTLHYPN